VTGVLSPVCCYQLTSALESECVNNERRSAVLQWIDPSDPSTVEETLREDEEDGTLETLPLYPLPATFLPDPAVNHTLRNVEPRNLRMALDLEKKAADCDNGDPRFFCVVLRAVDTGRIARVGTVMRVVDMEKQHSVLAAERGEGDDDPRLVRVVVTCQAQRETVDLVRIVNPEAASPESRIRRSSEYLRAIVRSRRDDSGREGGEKCSSALEALCQRASEEYGRVRIMYIAGVNNEKDLIGLPPFALEKLPEALPALSPDNFTSPELFWRATSVWQTLCNTVREGRQMTLAADRDELLVAAALQKGGPLRLPVDLEDVSPEERRKVTELEASAHREWLRMKLDPCLDFQVLLTMNDHTSRVAYFTSMVRRERIRLEEQMVAVMSDKEEKPPAPQHPRKGAWFEDDW
jgi:hypothetical protein